MQIKPSHFLTTVAFLLVFIWAVIATGDARVARAEREKQKYFMMSNDTGDYAQFGIFKIRDDTFTVLPEIIRDSCLKLFP